MRYQQPTLSPKTVTTTVATILAASELHAKQIESISHSVVGAMHGAQAGIAKIGTAAAAARGTNPKHGIKQFDRLLSNLNIDDDKAIRAHIRFVLGGRPQATAALDWTEYAEDGQHRIALSLVTRHGRSTPLVWRTVTDKQLTGRRNDHEDELLRRFKRLLPETVRQMTILADRGFGDVDLYPLLKLELGFDFIVRFRGRVRVEDEHGLAMPARKWVPSNGRARHLRHAKVTRQRAGLDDGIEAVVAVKKRGMKEAWLLATSLSASAEQIVAQYGRRFTIEENFRDEKDARFGLGVLNVRLRRPERRDRFTLILAIAMTLLTLLGAAGEALGLDRMLRANTVRRRTHSLFRQGREYLRGAVGKVADAARRLGDAFAALVRNQPSTTETFGEI